MRNTGMPSIVQHHALRREMTDVSRQSLDLHNVLQKGTPHNIVLSELMICWNTVAFEEEIKNNVTVHSMLAFAMYVFNNPMYWEICVPLQAVNAQV